MKNLVSVLILFLMTIVLTVSPDSVAQTVCDSDGWCTRDQPSRSPDIPERPQSSTPPRSDTSNTGPISEMQVPGSTMGGIHAQCFTPFGYCVIVVPTYARRGESCYCVDVYGNTAPGVL